MPEQRAEQHSLAGKTLLVTGGNTGIGLETALLFARQGANIVLFGIYAELNATVQRQIAALGVRARRWRLV
jgi:NAD(P)-dependent dehydrogenase (short-subunit alcohol dehydrogenase family)